MEPRLGDGDHPPASATVALPVRVPQWSPVSGTGITTPTSGVPAFVIQPQWSPVSGTGITARSPSAVEWMTQPQWSPVSGTGITGSGGAQCDTR